MRRPYFVLNHRRHELCCAWGLQVSDAIHAVCEPSRYIRNLCDEAELAFLIG